MNTPQSFYDLSDEEQVERLTLLAQAASLFWEGGFDGLQLVKYRENAVFSAYRPDGTRVAVRVHRHGYHEDAALQSELHWMRHVASRGCVPVPEVIASATGELVAQVSHEAVPECRRVSMLGWLPGTPVGTSEHGTDLGGEAARRTYFKAGVLAAHLHTSGATLPALQGFTRHSWDEDGLIGAEPLWGRFWENADLTPAQRALLCDAREAARDDLRCIDRTEANFGLIHADFVPENLLDEDGVLKLIDFDDAGYGWYAFELATALYFNIGEPAYPAIERALIDGYRTVRAFPAEHERLLPLFLFLRGTTYLGWVGSRPETETAKTLGPMLTQRACSLAAAYLDTRAGQLA